MWHHGTIKIDGAEIATSWKSHGGQVVAVDLRPEVAFAARIDIDGTAYIQTSHGTSHGDRRTATVMTVAEHERQQAEIAEADAKAKAEFEGKPWPAEPETREAKRGKSRQG